MTHPSHPPGSERTIGQSAQAPHPVLPRYYAQAEQRRGFVREMFERSAPDYDRVERLVGLGRGSWYRRQALARAGLKPGMRMLDVAAGTGLVTREALALLGDSAEVIAFDPSAAMLHNGAHALSCRMVRGLAEQLPFTDAQFDFISMGFALRHVTDLHAVFAEFRRVLRPGGIICVMEITPPEGVWARRLLKFYLGHAVPFVSRFIGRQAETPLVFRYFWDTIEACVPPARVLDALQAAGLSGVRRHVEARVFSEYTGCRLAAT